MVSREHLRDDTAVLTIRFGNGKRKWCFDVGDAAVAYAIKRDLLASIVETAHPDETELHACELIVAELIANAVRHAPGPLSLSLSSDKNGVFLHFIDEGPGFDFRATLPDDVWSENGRGLFLIAALAAAVTVTRLPGFGSYICVKLPLRANNGPEHRDSSIEVGR